MERSDNPTDQEQGVLVSMLDNVPQHQTKPDRSHQRIPNHPPSREQQRAPREVDEENSKPWAQRVSQLNVFPQISRPLLIDPNNLNNARKKPEYVTLNDEIVKEFDLAEDWIGIKMTFQDFLKCLWCHDKKEKLLLEQTAGPEPR